MTKRQLIATLGLTAKMLEELGGKMAQSPIGDQEFDDELNKSVMLAVANISRYRGELAGDLGIYETEAFEAFVRDEPEILDATG
ncbi:MAG: hypothetical protein ABNH53_07660 [Henriciella sp.]